jgi:hypothetical protein
VADSSRAVIPVSPDRFTYEAASGTGSGATQPQPTGTSPTTPTPASSQAWTSNEALLPFNANPVPDAALYAVSCPTTSTCVAGGDYTDTSGDQQALLMVESGGSWKAAQAPLPTNAGGNPKAAVYAVSCPTASECMAGGTYTDNNGDAQGLLLLWSGGGWTATEAPQPANASAASPPSTQVDGVSCPAVSECLAVGQYASAGYYQGWLLSWSGGSWSTSEAPLPGNAASIPDPMLTGVSCPSTSECVAIGDYIPTNSVPAQGVVLTWTGGSWTPQELAVTTSQLGTGFFSSLACPTTSACLSVGGDGAMLLSATNGSWAMTEEGTSYLYGVSCLTASECAVSGLGVADDGGWSALQLWSAGNWTSITTPVPANAASTTPPTQVCRSTACPARWPAPASPSATTRIPRPATRPRRCCWPAQPEAGRIHAHAVATPARLSTAKPDGACA